MYIVCPECEPLLARDRGPIIEVWDRLISLVGLASHMVRVGGHVVHAVVNCACNVSSSAHSNGCVVNGHFSRAAF